MCGGEEIGLGGGDCSGDDGGGEVGGEGTEEGGLWLPNMILRLSSENDALFCIPLGSGGRTLRWWKVLRARRSISCELRVRDSALGRSCGLGVSSPSIRLKW